MTDYSIAGSSGTTGLSQLTAPAPGDKIPVVDISDTTTAPAGSGGSDKYMTVATLGSAIAGTLYPSGDTSGATDAAAIQAAYTGGAKYIRLMPTAQWNVACGTVVINASGVYIDAAGCFISAKGAGDMIDMHDTSTFGTRSVYGGGILGFPVIDGTSCTGNSTALHMGDLFEATVHVQVQNFTAGTTSKGVWFDNRYWISEALHARVFASNCTAGVVFDVSVGNTNNTGSYERSVLDLQVNQGTPSFDGVVWQNGAFLQDGIINIFGNFGSSTSALTSAALRINGTTPGGVAIASNSNITNSVLNIGCEVDISSGSNVPSTIIFGTGNNFIGQCTGNVDFGAASAFTSSNSGGQFVGFVGVVAGDANLPAVLPAGSTNVADGNQTISATTATAITSLALPVAAFTAYKLDLYLPHVSASATGTYTIALGGPGINAASLDLTLWSGSTATPALRVSNLATGALLTTRTSTATQQALLVTGTIVFTAAGTLTVTALKSSGGANLTITAGASLDLLPLSAP